MSVFLTSLQNVLPIILIIVLGYVLRKINWLNETFAGQASKLIMNVALPSSIFVAVLKNLSLNQLLQLGPSVLIAAISFALSYVVGFLVINVFRVQPGRRGLMLNTFANANTIFIGMPLNLALFGEHAVPYFLVYYIMNTISTWAIGIFFIYGDPMPTENDGEKNNAARHKFNISKLLPPPLLGFLVALVFLVFNIPVPAVVNTGLTYLGNLVTPLSLIYIGIILQETGLSSIRIDRDTAVTLIGKFVIAPLIMVGVITAFTGVFGAQNVLETRTFIIQAAVPALTVLPILANEGKADVKFATNVVATSTVLFAIVIPIVMTIIG